MTRRTKWLLMLGLIVLAILCVALVLNGNV
jgi:hypothetical protein